MTPENLRKQNHFIFNAICSDFDDNFIEIIAKIDEIELVEETDKGYECELWRINLIEQHKVRPEVTVLSNWWAIVDVDDREAYLYQNKESAISKWNKIKGVYIV